MINQRTVCTFAIILCLLLPVCAAESGLTQDDYARVQRAKKLLAEVDNRPVQAIIDEFNRADFPEGNVQIYEAVAATYRDLAVRKELTAFEDKKSLYDSIRMNVAFLQFGGDIGHTGDKKLNQWIR